MVMAKLKPKRTVMSERKQLAHRKALAKLGNRRFVCDTVGCSQSSYSHYIRLGVPVEVAVRIKQVRKELGITKSEMDEVLKVIAPVLVR